MTVLSGSDRTYLPAMYNENAEQARQHETLRAASVGFLVALIAGLFVIGIDQEKSNLGWVAWALVCTLSVMEIVLN